MNRGKRVPTHPGEVLQKEYLEPLGLTQVKLAEHIGVPVQLIDGIIRGKRDVKPKDAWILAQALGTTPEFWMNLQTNYDLARARPTRSVSKLRSPNLHDAAIAKKRRREPRESLAAVKRRLVRNGKLRPR